MHLFEDRSCIHSSWFHGPEVSLRCFSFSYLGLAHCPHEDCWLVSTPTFNKGTLYQSTSLSPGCSTSDPWPLLLCLGLGLQKMTQVFGHCHPRRRCWSSELLVWTCLSVGIVDIYVVNHGKKNWQIISLFLSLTVFLSLSAYLSVAFQINSEMNL